MTSDGPSSENDGQSLSVDLGERAYSIHIGDGLVDEAGLLCAPVLGSARVFIVTDEHVAALYLERVAASFAAVGIASDYAVLLPGEATKSLENLGRLLEVMFEKGCDRTTTVVALGGGVIGDIAGFAAAVFMRGVDFIQLPTTLLAQVDSSVGGKTGVNAKAGKNLIGAFHQPKTVLADIGVLDTLDRRERRAGYAEVVKYGLLGDADFFDWLEDNGAAVLAPAGEEDRRAVETAVLKSCRAKAEIVKTDEREGGVRALLNLGHTFAHALEAEAGYDGSVLHGEAVSVGMVLAFELSAALGLCAKAETETVKAHLERLGLPVRVSRLFSRPPDTDRLMMHMARDKKVQSGQMTFILVQGIGRAFISSDVPGDAVRAVWDAAG